MVYIVLLPKELQALSFLWCFDDSVVICKSVHVCSVQCLMYWVVA